MRADEELDEHCGEDASGVREEEMGTAEGATLWTRRRCLVIVFLGEKSLRLGVKGLLVHGRHVMCSAADSEMAVTTVAGEVDVVGGV